MADSHGAVAHHFDDVEQQHEAATLGMWAFLVTEIMFFGGMFLGYTVYRSVYPDAFAHASNHMDVVLGTVNTAVLIGSSLSVAMAVHAAHASKPKALLVYLFADHRARSSLSRHQIRRISSPLRSPSGARLELRV